MAQAVQETPSPTSARGDDDIAGEQDWMADDGRRWTRLIWIKTRVDEVTSGKKRPQLRRQVGARNLLSIVGPEGGQVAGASGGVSGRGSTVREWATHELDKMKTWLAKLSYGKPRPKLEGKLVSAASVVRHPSVQTARLGSALTTSGAAVGIHGCSLRQRSCSHLLSPRRPSQGAPL